MGSISPFSYFSGSGGGSYVAVKSEEQPPPAVAGISAAPPQVYYGSYRQAASAAAAPRPPRTTTTTTTTTARPVRPRPTVDTSSHSKYPEESDTYRSYPNYPPLGSGPPDVDPEDFYSVVPEEDSFYPYLDEDKVMHVTITTPHFLSWLEP